MKFLTEPMQEMVAFEEAKKLLAQTNLPASKISEILAFSEAKYFASVFKKIVGLSPIAFRNSLKKG